MDLQVEPQFVIAEPSNDYVHGRGFYRLPQMGELNADSRSLINMSIVLASMALVLLQPSEPSPDFAIRFDHKGCHYEYIDTFKGTYSHTGATSPVPFVLSDDQKRMLFATITAAGFFDLPSRTPGAGSGDPSGNVELDVRNAGKHHKGADDLTLVQEALGHRDSRTTRIYTTVG